MDRNTILGLLFIGLILIGYSVIFKPSEQELEKMRKQQDSMANMQQLEDSLHAQRDAHIAQQQEKNQTTSLDSAGEVMDSVLALNESKKYGQFSDASKGEEEYYIIENEKVKIKISTLGGRMVSAELKQYRTHDSLPLYLFIEDSSQFDINFYNQNKYIHTSELFFKPIGRSFQVKGNDTKQLSMRLYPNNKTDGYIEFLYSLKGGSYMIDFNIRIVGLPELVKENRNELGCIWSMTALSKEKGIKYERRYTSIYYRYMDDEVDHLSTMKSEITELEARTHWVAFTQQFFSAVLIAENGFDKYNSELMIREMPEEDSVFTKYLSATLTLDLNETENPDIPLMVYLGPNHYQTLKSYDIGLEDQIDLGWAIFAWVNKFLIIPIFNFLDGFNMNYGLIILILTLIIKTLLFPLTYKNYKSTAKMRVLKPEIEAINAKFKKEDQMKKQQATMALYRSAGVNPMAGCVPALLQMPILIAMYRFFPSSIELRQQAFLWASDLSTYDSVLDLDFNIPFYGNHVSLFTLLMAVSTFLYSKYNMQTSAAGGQMAQMKIMIYFMPVMLLCVFNDFAAGLSYYYFTANAISIAQQLVIKKWFIDEDAIRKQIERNKKKPSGKKKSKFLERLEKMQREREKQLRQSNRRKR